MHWWCALAVLGAAIEARADCQYVRGSIAETRISLGHGTGQISGHGDWRVERRRHGDLAQRAAQRVRSLDIFVTKSGDVLRTEGLPTRTPIPGAPPGEFTAHVDLDITGGWGKYEGAYGTMEYDGLGHTGAVPPTTDFVYKGTVCGPNIKGDGH